MDSSGLDALHIARALSLVKDASPPLDLTTPQTPTLAQRGLEPATLTGMLAARRIEMERSKIESLLRHGIELEFRAEHDTGLTLWSAQEAEFELRRGQPCLEQDSAATLTQHPCTDYPVAQSSVPYFPLWSCPSTPDLTRPAGPPDLCHSEFLSAKKHSMLPDHGRRSSEFSQPLAAHETDVWRGAVATHPTSNHSLSGRRFLFADHAQLAMKITMARLPGVASESPSHLTNPVSACCLCNDAPRVGASTLPVYSQPQVTACKLRDVIFL
ncbi:unnamed protein product [Protopolystoma xenopodis]|uniref:Uncharacterized protein n=1 Tax=Protopolystoma xenopodis TaxID=117903 RepID=A0A448X6P5_9PLAT|nr:unnamed protein product [Protopolystoma xenopodis]